MKINLSNLDDYLDEFEDKWERRDRKVNNRSKLKPPTENKEKIKKEEKPLTKVEKGSIIEP
tara:strand:+ start:854 stop:1036 length:183 start_codon:yes stop_codon:yes gene_type:complete